MQKQIVTVLSTRKTNQTLIRFWFIVHSKVEKTVTFYLFIKRFICRLILVVFVLHAHYFLSFAKKYAIG